MPNDQAAATHTPNGLPAPPDPHQCELGLGGDGARHGDSASATPASDTPAPDGRAREDGHGCDRWAADDRDPIGADEGVLEDDSWRGRAEEFPRPTHDGMGGRIAVSEAIVTAVRPFLPGVEIEAARSCCALCQLAVMPAGALLFSNRFAYVSGGPASAALLAAAHAALHAAGFRATTWGATRASRCALMSREATAPPTSRPRGGRGGVATARPWPPAAQPTAEPTSSGPWRSRGASQRSVRARRGAVATT